MNSSDERDQAGFFLLEYYQQVPERKVEEREKKLRDTKKRRTTSIQ